MAPRGSNPDGVQLLLLGDCGAVCFFLQKYCSSDSKRSPPRWGTTTRASACAPTTPPGRPSAPLRMPWAALCPRSYNHQRPPGQEFLPRWSLSVYDPSRIVGHGVGQIIPPNILIIFISRKHLETLVSRCFWSCYPDSNWRPHPYQGCALPPELQQRVRRDCTQQWRRGRDLNPRPPA